MPRTIDAVIDIVDRGICYGPVLYLPELGLAHPANVTAAIQVAGGMWSAGINGYVFDRAASEAVESTREMGRIVCLIA